MKIVVACDSFKGCLSAKKVCAAIKSGILLENPSAEVVLLPMSDGGEGFSQCFYDNCGGDIIETTVSNPIMQDTKAEYVMLPYKTSVIETAAASGIMTLDKNKLSPLKTTTYGTGELIADAVKRGAKHIILGLGGSATNDGGMGVLSALGVRFYNENREVLFPNGDFSRRVGTLELTDSFYRYKDIKFTLACDVQNPYYGKNGAAYVFAAQKGADSDMIIKLDRGLENLARVFKEYNGVDLQSVKGAGAAGGLCGGMYAMLDCKIESGFETLCTAINFEEKIKDADLIITGEGKTDIQTAFGKLPKRVADKAGRQNIDCILISGDISDNAEIEKLGFCKTYKLKADNKTTDYAIKNAANLLEKTAAEMIRMRK